MKRRLSSLIKVDARASTGDFNGPFSSLSVEEQVDYLKRYYAAFSKEWSFDPKQNLVTGEEIDTLFSSLPKEDFSYRNRRILNQASIAYKNRNPYRRLRLYTKECQVDGKNVLMGQKNAAPLPSFEIESEEAICSVSLPFQIGGEFQAAMKAGIDTMVPGKTIEFKDGFVEVLKLGLYPNGTVYARVLEKDPYHHTNILLGPFAYDTPNSLEVSFRKEKISIVLNGEASIVANLSGKLPTAFFAGSGLHGGFPWQIAVDSILNEKGQPIDVFEPASFAESSLADQTIPSAFGTYDHRGQTIVANFPILIEKEGRHLLHIDDLGPSGRVLINGQIAVEIFSPRPIHQDIGDFLHLGENAIAVELDPQAPENYVPWHRHQDPFFGSYLGTVAVDEVNENYIDSLAVVTSAVSPLISFRVNAEVTGEGACFISVYDLDGTIRMEEAEASGLLEFEGIPWSPSNPKLYRVVCTLKNNSKTLDRFEIITGFRVLSQQGGRILCNDSPIVLKGALLMQYLPPYKDIPLNHVCPSMSQILWQCLLAKKMGANCLRMHQLGYGCNDPRFARACDYLGIATIWTTRYIDSVYGVVFDGKWAQASLYQEQIKEVINAPSIFVWEGANELYLTREETDRIYDEFVTHVKEKDDTRLLSPVSHLYYGNDSYDHGCEYYQEDGERDEFFRPAKSSFGWNDDKVIRSAHTYDWLLGYGNTWDRLKGQSWSAQPGLLSSEKHAYLITEYAVIGRQCPETPEAKEYFNNDSYEVGDEKRLGYVFGDKEWQLSQAYQALCAAMASRTMLSLGVDGMLWCSLTGGANNASYFKPIIDFYGHPKLAFYSLKECFTSTAIFLSGTDVVWNEKTKVGITILQDEPIDSSLDAVVEIVDENDAPVANIAFNDILLNKKIVQTETKAAPKLKDGFYKVFIKTSRRNSNEQ